MEDQALPIIFDIALLYFQHTMQFFAVKLAHTSLILDLIY